MMTFNYDKEDFLCINLPINAEMHIVSTLTKHLAALEEPLI